jgi:hypothetical protein
MTDGTWTHTVEEPPPLPSLFLSYSDGRNRGLHLSYENPNTDDLRLALGAFGDLVESFDAV